jgi:cysteine desulfurase
VAAYLDHAATTPMVPAALSAMAAELARVGNPSSLHAAGRAARKVVEEGREQVAAALGARPSEVVFTGSGTEANNLAVKGLYWHARSQDPRRTRVLASSIEHHAVMDPVQWLADHEGADVVWIPVDSSGRLDVDALKKEIDRDPASIALITVMWANNEVGTLQPISDVVALAEPHDIPVHSDAVQAFGKIPLDFDSSGLAAMTVTAHKIGGPLGIGALVVRRGVNLTPVLHGGGQERDLRSGTLDAPAIAGFAAAALHTAETMDERAGQMERLRQRLVNGVLGQAVDARLNGTDDSDLRLASITHFTFPGCEGDALLLLLDARGVECSTGSACSAGVPRPSHVLLAMGFSEQDARASLRFSLGHSSTDADVDALINAIAAVVERGRLAGQMS